MNRNKRIKPLKDILIHTQRFRSAYQHAQQVNTLEAQLVDVIPGALVDLCRILNFDGQTLIIECDNSAVATQLQYLAPNILKSLKNNHKFSQLDKIRVRLKAYDRNQRNKKVRRPAPIPTQGIELLTETAELTDSPELELALKRLIKHGAASQ